MIHLLHPGFVHFAVAFLVAGGLTEAFGIVARRPACSRFGSTLVVVGTIWLVPTMVTGFLAQNSLDVSQGADLVMGRHEKTGIALFGLFAVALFWKGWVGGELPDRQRLPYAAYLLVGVLLAAYAAFLGGQMVFEHGVGVRIR